MVVCSISTATSSSAITSSQSVPVPQDHQQQQQPECQRGVTIGSVRLRVDDDKRTDAKLMKCSADSCPTGQLGSLNGILPISSHLHNSPEKRRVHRSDMSPYHSMTIDTLRQQTAGQRMPLGWCPGSWQLQFGSSSYERNGLLPSSDNDRMDTSDDMPLNLSTGVRSSMHQSTNVDSRRKIFTSGESFLPPHTI